MGGASVVCFWEAKSGSGEVASWLLVLWEERVLERKGQINLGRLDCLSAAKFRREKGVCGGEMERKLGRKDFSESWRPHAI